MFGVALKMSLDRTAFQQMDEFARTFPEKIQKRVFSVALKKAGQASANRLETHIPLGTKPHGFIGPQLHIRDAATFRVRHYKAGRSLAMVGYKSGFNNLQTLMERGNFLTSPRMTRHESKTGRVHVPGKVIMRREKYKRADGSWRYGPMKPVRLRDNRRSTGSRAIGTQGPFRGAGGKFVRGGHAHSTGDFPKSKKPFRPVGKTYDEMRHTINDIMYAEIAAGFERAFYREAGKP